jgi:putative tricarboxylic transport membrane protein
MAPAAPGGGWDQTARTLQAVIQENNLLGNVQVMNVPGAGGTIGLAQVVNSQQGNNDYFMVTGLIMMGAILTNQSAVTLDQVTPIARLIGEYEVMVVPADSPYQTLGEFI